ncbi:hypothetical protein [Azospirillum sp. sgz302134]
MRRLPARSLAVALVLVATAASSPARADAPPVTEDGAKVLAVAIKDGLARWFPKAKDGGAEFRWKGNPTATPAGDHYDVALPALSALSDDGTSTEVGVIRLTVKPQDGGTHAVTATLPDSIAVLNNGKPAATIRIGRQRLAGVWSGAFETLLSADSELGDIAVASDKKAAGKGNGKGDAKGGKDDGTLTIGAITLAGDLKPDGATTWSGPGALSVSNVRFLDGQNKEVMALAGLTMEGSYTRIDLPRATALQRLTQAHAVAGTEPKAAELVPLMQGVMGGMSFRVRLSGLSAVNPEDGTRFSLSQLSARGGAEDMDRPMGGATLGFEASGVELTPPVAPKAFMPERMELQLSLTKMPSGAFWKAIADLAALAEQKTATAADSDEEEDDEDAPDTAANTEAEAIGNRLVAALTEAGSELRIDKLAVDTPATSGSVTGAARMAANTAFGAVGGATVLLRGLDGAAKALQPAAGKKADKETQDALGMIAMLQAMGQLSKDESGADLRTYKIDLTDAGQVLLNGADMNAMMGGAGGGAPEPQPTAKKTMKKP